ncbi:MAG: helix-turn-helix domain-containing protein [Candidatus Izemoplasmatales bacterium]|nr:helix-turn-helix domain-containing protein [Candidatus Izemoplasmatales bacterium]
MASKGQKFKKVPLEERLNAVKEKIQEGKSYTYLAQKYEVSWNTVESWVRTYRRDEGLDIRAKGRPKKEETIDYKERYEILKKFQEYLKEVDQEKK